MPNNIRWQQSEINTLKQYYHNTIIEALMEKLPGRSIEAIRSMACRLGLKRKVRPKGIHSKKSTFYGRPEVIEKIRQEYNQGNITQMQLAKKYNTSEGTINGITLGRQYRNCGGPISKIYRLTEATVSNLREERLNGSSLKQLAEKYGVSKSMVSRIALGNRHSEKPGPLVDKPWGLIVR